MLIYNDAFEAKRESSLKFASFESQLWSINVYGLRLHVLGVYHPPQTSNICPDSIFIDQICDTIQDLAVEKSNIILTGDFNLHVNDLSCNDSVIFLDAMSALGFTQLVKTATHNSGNTLDLILVEDPDLTDILLRCDVMSFLSDHRWLFCEFNKHNERKLARRITSRKLSDDATEIINNFDNNWSVLDEVDPVELFEEYHRKMSELYDKIAPEKSLKASNRKRLPWFTAQTKDQKKIVRNRERIWLKYQGDSHWKALKRERCRYRNMLNFNRTQAISGAILDVKGDTKKLYQVVNEITGSEKTNPMPSYVHEQDLAEEFAEFFLQKILKIRDLFKNIKPFSCERNMEVPTFTKFSVLTELEVKKLIMQMKTKSCELDPIPTKILKDHIDVFLPIMTKIVNVSLTSGVFYENWKCAIVRPLLKKLGLELIKKNYRPVSNLSFISKLVEKATLSQFMDHCEEYHLLPDHQNAYRKGYSCETCVVKFVNDALWNMENCRVTVCAFLDLSAAFDTVDHDLLLYILDKSYGFTGTALKWYENYLRPRSFKVSVGDTYSAERPLTFSVPQGSASGANIFTAYCASYKNAIPPSLSLQGFADDHFIYTHFDPNSSEQNVQKISEIQHAMELTKNWMSSMRLKLNPDKTEFMLIGFQRQLDKVHCMELNLGNESIAASNAVKCLGAWIDKNLNFQQHIIKKSQAAMLNFRKIKAIRKFLSTEACETLVITLVVSHLDYCNSILLGLPTSTLKPFQRIQNMSAKLTLNMTKFDSSTSALKKLNWLPIRERIHYKVLSLIHKSLFGTAPEYLKNMFTKLPTAQRTLRSSMDTTNKLLVPFVKKKTFANRSISVMGPVLWNQLPRHLRNIDSFETFKSHLKTHLIAKTYY